MGCCSVPQIDFDSQEAKDGRRCTAKRYGTLALIQFPLAVLVTLSGATSFGLSLHNPNWPFVNVFPFVLGTQVLVAAYFGRRIAGAEVDQDISKSLRTALTVNYVMYINCMTFTSLSATFSGQAVGNCYSSDLDNQEKCTPNMDALKGFNITNIVLTGLIWPTVFYGMSLNYYARKFGLFVPETDHDNKWYDIIEDEKEPNG